MNKKITSALLLSFLATVFFLPTSFVFGEEKAEKSIPASTFKKLQGEILEVEELKDPQGAAIYTVRDLASGTTHQFFAHPYRTVIQMGGETTAVTDVSGGSKVTIIYRESSDRDIPEIVFAKVASAIYS